MRQRNCGQLCTSSAHPSAPTSTPTPLQLAMVPSSSARPASPRSVPVRTTSTHAHHQPRAH